MTRLVRLRPSPAAGAADQRAAPQEPARAGRALAGPSSEEAA